MDDNASELVSFIYCSGQIIGILGKLSEESSDERVTCSVRINDFRVVNWRNWDEFNGGLLAGATSGHDSWVGTLCDDYDTGALGVRLLIFSDDLGGTLAVVCLKTICCGEGGALIFIAEHEVGVLNCILNRVQVELDYKEGGQVEGERLVVSGGEVAEFLNRSRVRVDEESRGVKELGPVQHFLRQKYY